MAPAERLRNIHPGSGGTKPPVTDAEWPTAWCLRGSSTAVPTSRTWRHSGRALRSFGVVLARTQWGCDVAVERSPAVQGGHGQAGGGGEHADGAGRQQDPLGADRLDDHAAGSKRQRQEHQRAEVGHGGDPAAQPVGQVALQAGDPQQLGELLAGAKGQPQQHRQDRAVGNTEALVVSAHTTSRVVCRKPRIIQGDRESPHRHLGWRPCRTSIWLPLLDQPEITTPPRGLDAFGRSCSTWWKQCGRLQIASASTRALSSRQSKPGWCHWTASCQVKAERTGGLPSPQQPEGAAEDSGETRVLVRGGHGKPTRRSGWRATGRRR